MSSEKYEIDDDKLYVTRLYPVVDHEGFTRNFQGDTRFVISKEGFIMAYNEWIKPMLEGKNEE